MLMRMLVSVSDKEGLVTELILPLRTNGEWDIVATGGTAAFLRESDIPLQTVEDVTGMPHMLGDRMKTLFPGILGGVLARRDADGTVRPEDVQTIADRFGSVPFDLLVLDLYHIEERIAEGASVDVVRETIDIGGVTCARGGAKAGIPVVIDRADWPAVVEWFREGQPDRTAFVNRLAAKVLATCARKDLAAAEYLGSGAYAGVIGRKVDKCKYGENAWQEGAALYDAGTDDPLALSRFTLVDGDAPSYNNLCDVDRLLQTITHVAAVFARFGFPMPMIALGGKHGNTCGAAARKWLGDALQGMLRGDPLAIFGGLVITNFVIDESMARYLRHIEGSTQKRLFDGILAPAFTAGAKEELHRKGGKCRLLTNAALGNLTLAALDRANRFRYVRGGFLRQPNYTYVLDLRDPELECTGEPLTEVQCGDLLLAWAVGSTSNSNTVTLVKNGMLIGNGVGQQDRVGAATLAIERAKRGGHDLHGSVAYSDSFFPFPDGPQTLIDAGVEAILATSGSVNDDATREVCRNAGVTLVLIPDRKARGFFGH